MFIAGNLIPSLIALGNPGFVPTVWQGYLFVVALCVICFLINGYLAKHLPLLEGFVLCITIMAFVAIVIVLLVLSPKESGSEVWQTFTPQPELGSDGMLSLIAAQVLLIYSLVASDSTAHMAEETQHAAYVIPRAMVWSYFIIGLLDFVMLLAVCFIWVDPNFYANNSTHYAFLALFITATGSANGAIAITSIMILLTVLSLVNFMASTSRQVFAFARDDGLPFSRWISKVNKKTLTPMNALVVVLVFVVLICLIGLGSTV
jgi:amino acid transporter